MENSKNKYQQSWEINSNPLSVSVKSTIVDVKKANTKSEAVHFNLALLDENSSKVRKSKELYSLEFKSSEINSIKISEEEEEATFENKLSIFFGDEVSANSCDSLLKLAILEAKVLFEKENNIPSTYNELSNFITSKLQGFSTKNTDVSQKLTYDKVNKDVLVIDTEQTQQGKEKVIQKVKFSLGDLDPDKVVFKNDDNYFKLILNTKQKQKFIEISEVNDSKAYESTIALLVGNPEDALLLSKAFKSQIDLAKAILDQRQLVFTSVDEAKLALKKAIKIEEENGTQKLEFEGNKAIIMKSDGTNTFSQEFYFEDLNDDLNLSFKRGEITANLETKSNLKYVKDIKAGEVKSFTDELDIKIPDVESMRIVSNALTYIEQNGTMQIEPQSIHWFSTTLAAQNPSLNQRLKLQDEECKYLYSYDDNSETVQQTFFLYDIEPQSINIDPSGKVLYLEAKTISNHPFIQEKVKDNDTKFIKNMSFGLNDSRDARLAHKTLVSEIEKCNEYFKNSSTLVAERDSQITKIQQQKKARRTLVFKNGSYFHEKSSAISLSVGMLSNVNLKETAILNDDFETGVLLPGLQLTYERQAWKNFGLGLSLGTQFWRVKGGGDSENYGTLTYRYGALGTRATYHFNLNNKFDPYIGASFSARVMDITNDAKSLQARYDFRVSWLVGLKYYYSKQWGLFIEAGDETVNWLRLGITYYN